MVDGDPAAQEAARLRYELARLQDRRTVRTALALTSLRRHGRGTAWAALTGRLPRLDVPGPSRVPGRPPYPHLRVAHTGDGSLVAGAAAAERLDPTGAEVVLDRDRPDLLLIDAIDGFDPDRLRSLATRVREHGGAVVTADPRARDAVDDADLQVVRTDLHTMRTDVAGEEAGSSTPPGDDHLVVPGAVDVRAWSPVGLDDATPAHRRNDAGALTLADARRQPVVAVPDVPAIGVRRCLELLAAGAVVVAVDHPELRAALDGLDPTTRDEVLVPAGTLDASVEALLADDDRRRRSSVRLRRHVQTSLSTRRVVQRIVTTLGIDRAPDERLSVLLASRRPDRVRPVLDALAAQRHADLEVLLLPHGDAPLDDGVADHPVLDRIERVDGSRPLGAVLNVGLDLATGAYIAKIDDDDRYGPDHLSDQLLALHASGAQIVGRRVHAVYHEATDRTVLPPPGGEERFEDHLPGATMVLPADVLRAVRWRHVPRAVDTELVRAIHLDGGAAYTSHRYGFVRVRHTDHTAHGVGEDAGTSVPGSDPSLLEA